MGIASPFLRGQEFVIDCSIEMMNGVFNNEQRRERTLEEEMERAEEIVKYRVQIPDRIQGNYPELHT